VVALFLLLLLFCFVYSVLVTKETAMTFWTVK